MVIAFRGHSILNTMRSIGVMWSIMQTRLFRMPRGREHMHAAAPGLPQGCQAEADGSKLFELNLCGIAFFWTSSRCTQL